MIALDLKVEWERLWIHVGFLFGWWKCSEIRGDDYKALWITWNPIKLNTAKGWILSYRNYITIREKEAFSKAAFGFRWLLPAMSSQAWTHPWPLCGRGGLSCDVSKLLALGGNDRNWFNQGSLLTGVVSLGTLPNLSCLSSHLKNGLSWE